MGTVIRIPARCRSIFRGHGDLALVAAALPIGANVFMFAQRYDVKVEQTTAAVAVSTGLSVVTLSVVMALIP